MTTTEKRRIAVHEAGHAVCALLLGRRMSCAIGEDCGWTDISPEPGLEPDYWQTSDRARQVERDPADLQTLLDDAVLYASGAAAESMVKGALSGRDVIVRGSDADLIERAAAAFLEKYPNVEAVGCFKQMAAASAVRLLGPHIASVRAVADALYRERRLSAARVAEIHTGTQKVKSS